jgi:hypothetical protein
MVRVFRYRIVRLFVVGTTSIGILLQTLCLLLSITTTRSEDLFIQVRIQLHLSYVIVKYLFRLFRIPTCIT